MFAVDRFTGYVWTEGGTAKKSLRFQLYPDACGRGLKPGLVEFLFFAKIVASSPNKNLLYIC